MRSTHWLSAVVVLVGIEAPPSTPLARQQAVKPYDAIVAGTSCKQSTNAVSPSSQIECTYRVGVDLVFQIVGVGEADASIGVRKAGDYEAADYVFDFGMGHRCVIVSAGNRIKRILGALVLPGFVSPRTGKVFRSWQECSRG